MTIGQRGKIKFQGAQGEALGAARLLGGSWAPIIIIMMLMMLMMMMMVMMMMKDD